MNIQCGIYSLTNIVNGKRNIGQSTNILIRWWNHKWKLRINKHYNPHLQAAWNKYGEQNFKFEIMLLCPIELLDSEEIRLIKEHKTLDRMFGYNIDEGGHGHHKLSEETKQKLKMSHLGKKASEETKQKMRKSHANQHHTEEIKKLLSEINKKRNPEINRKISKTLMGHCISAETKLKISKTLIGHCISAEAKLKISKALTGIKRSDETKKRMSDVKMGHTTSKEARTKMSKSRTNKKRTDETKRRISLTMKERWKERKINALIL